MTDEIKIILALGAIVTSCVGMFFIIVGKLKNIEKFIHSLKQTNSKGDNSNNADDR